MICVNLVGFSALIQGVFRVKKSPDIGLDLRAFSKGLGRDINERGGTRTPNQVLKRNVVSRCSPRGNPCPINSVCKVHQAVKTA